MVTRNWLLVGAFLLSAALGPGALVHPAPRAPTAAEALAAIQPGQWHLRSRNPSAPDETMCLDVPVRLAQAPLWQAQCGFDLISAADNHIVIHYRCSGAGRGLTTLHIETSRLVQIESEGIAGVEPFAVSYEARRIGDCRFSAGRGLRR